MTSLFQKFPNAPQAPEVRKAEGTHIVLDDGSRLLDVTSGLTGFATLGYSHPEIVSAIQTQLGRYPHLDLNIWQNPSLNELADLLVSQAPPGLDRTYFAGSSGSEAIEAALKLSYQVHVEQGRASKTRFISRARGFAGATLQAIAVSDLPLLDMYEPLLPDGYIQIPAHDPLNGGVPNESLEDYGRRSATELETAIIEAGPDTVCAFIGETILGTLAGHVVPAPGYWRAVREVCDRYNVHLVLDEVYCGLGRSGRVHCCSWDNVSPDFLCVGKNLAAGYAPLSAVLLRHEFEAAISQGSGRVAHGHTFQGHAIAAAAALAAQKIVHDERTLAHVSALGRLIEDALRSQLTNHPYSREIRGRGGMWTIEFDCPTVAEFTAELGRRMREQYGVLIDSRHHRTSFVPAYITTLEEMETVMGQFAETVGQLTASWANEAV